MSVQNSSQQYLMRIWACPRLLTPLAIWILKILPTYVEMGGMITVETFKVQTHVYLHCITLQLAIRKRLGETVWLSVIEGDGALWSTAANLCQI